MAESRIRDDNYYQVSGWMLNRLGLKGTALQVYAIIYGFSQDRESCFTGSVQYLCSFTNASKNTVIKALRDLVALGYIVKTESLVNGVRVCTYRTNMRFVGGGAEIAPPVQKLVRGGAETGPGVVQKLDQGGAETAPNNKSNNKPFNNKGDKEERAPALPKYGEFENVVLSDAELEKIKTKFPEDWRGRIENLSAYIAQTGKKYESHYATILNWARRDKEKAAQGNQGRGARGRKEMVPAWMDDWNKNFHKETPEEYFARIKRLAAEMGGDEPATVENDPELAARAESLRQELGQKYGKDGGR